MRIFLSLLAILVMAGCSSSTAPDSTELSQTAVIGNWNKFENQDIFTPSGFRFQVNFRADGRYVFTSFDLNEVAGTWRFDDADRIVISDDVCSFDGTYNYDFVDGKLHLESADGFDDQCGRATRLMGEWLRSGISNR